jgi:A-macroglobulin complement component/MG2 domain-containing protein/alpha-2-macroglobulin family protein
MGFWQRWFGKDSKTPAKVSRVNLGDGRRLAFVATDKPVYRPGEKVYARCVLLDAFSRQPEAQPFTVTWQVKSPKGDVCHELARVVSEAGVAGFHWQIPDAQPGGEYTLRVRLPSLGYPPAEVTFDVRAYRVPRLRTELEFVKKAYGPGDRVAATLTATRAEGGVPEGAAVTAVATLDGVELHRQELALNARGGCGVSFRLPETIGEGEGTLVMIVRDGGVQETAAKTLPIVVARVGVTVFPEGGDLVAGVRSRLYVEARTPRGKPADIAGRVLDPQGRELGRVRTEHEGRGWVEFTPPSAGQGYTIALDEPAGIVEPVALPEVARDGFGLRALDAIVEPGAPVRVRVSAGANAQARVALYQRDRELANHPVTPDEGRPAELALEAPAEAAGVLRVTVYDEEGLPRAERLVFRRPARSLTLEIEATPPEAGLREGVSVRVRARDQAGAPSKATVIVSVVDDALLETVEKRERAPRLPAQALFEADVRELRDAHAYLEGPDGPRNVDLLLGTQGWRRFAFYRVDEFAREHGDRAERALARRAPPEPEAMPQFAMAFGAVPGGPPPMPRAAAPKPSPAAPKGGAPPGALPPAPGAPPPPARPAPLAEGAPLAPPPAPGPPPAFAPAPAAPPPAFAPAPALAAPMAPTPPPALAAPMPAPPMADIPPAPPFAPGAPMPGPAPGAPMRALRPPMAPPMPPPMPPLPRVVAVREYAHRAPTTEGRTDFAETLYWQAGVATDDAGEARFGFDLGDSVTSFRVRVDAVDAAGGLGAADALIEARRPFYLEPKLALEVSAGDRVLVPVALTNGTRAPIDVTLAAAAKGLARVEGEPEGAKLAARSGGRRVIALSIGQGAGDAELRVSARAGSLADEVTRSLKVAPVGFPLAHDFGGRLGEGPCEHALTLPDAVAPGSLVARAVAYPSPLASLIDAVAALLREPCGCFEQTSSSNYPNVMALQYMTSHAGVDAALVKRAQALLEAGYKRLVGYECKKGGYEWFGDDPGHEALTAYGLLEFADMAEVFPVDPQMVERTRAWLLGRRDGKGGYKRNARALDSFGGAPSDVTDAYITWALSSAKVPGLEPEIARVRGLVETTNNSYVLALGANVLLDAGDPAAALALEKLGRAQAQDGAVRGATTSITRSGGQALVIETTALAALAWLRVPDEAARLEQAMAFIQGQCQGGRFASTQATILALKAIVAYDQARSRLRVPGTLELQVDGRGVAFAQFSADHDGPIELGAFAHALGPGPHTLALVLRGGSPMPYAIHVGYHTPQPASSPSCPLRLATRLARDRAREGEAVDVAVSLENLGAEGLPMAVAIIGLPGGLEARPDQLKELVKAGRVDFVETRGREVILYLRAMAPSQKLELTLSCLAAVPGDYQGPASRAYLYYTDEHKHWAAPLQITIEPG